MHAVYRVPIEELLDPAHRMSVWHPSGWKGPGFWIGDRKDLILWGFTAGIISRLFDFLGWTRAWDESVLGAAARAHAARPGPAARGVNALDWILVVLVVAYAVSGYWQGFIAGSFATAGLLLGGLLGIKLAPTLLEGAGPALWVSVAALFVVLVCASFGQAVLQFAGSRIRSRIRWQPARALDAVGGAALSMAAVLVVAWALGVAVSGSRLPWASDQVRASTVLEQVDA